MNQFPSVPAGYVVTYMDRKGAGCVRRFSNEIELEAFVSTLRREAVIYFNEQKIGEVYRNTGEADDRRIKWLWSFEKQFPSVPGSPSEVRTLAESECNDSAFLPDWELDPGELEELRRCGDDY